MSDDEKNEASNLEIRSNLMPHTDPSQNGYNRHLPGDYVFEIYGNIVSSDSRVIQNFLTERQMAEYTSNLVCCRCKKRCRGSCVWEAKRKKK